MVLLLEGAIEMLHSPPLRQASPISPHISKYLPYISPISPNISLISPLYLRQASRALLRHLQQSLGTGEKLPLP